jgi:hypothetical protein
LKTKAFERGESNGRKTLHNQRLKLENNKSPATENANGEFGNEIYPAYVDFQVLNSMLYHIIDPFDDIGNAKMGKIRIMIPYVNATTLDGIARKQN